MQFVDIIYLLPILRITIINVVDLDNITMGYYGKGSMNNNYNKTNLLPIILLVASAAAIVAMLIFQFFGVYFFFFSTANLQFALVNKKTMGSQGKEAMECRGSPLASSKEFSLCKIRIKRSLHTLVFDKNDRYSLAGRIVIDVHCSSQESRRRRSIYQKGT